MQVIITVAQYYVHSVLKLTLHNGQKSIYIMWCTQLVLW